MIECTYLKYTLQISPYKHWLLLSLVLIVVVVLSPIMHLTHRFIYTHVGVYVYPSY